MHTGERPVYKRRVLMTVKNLCLGAPGNPRHLGRKTSMKSGLAIQNVERNTFCAELVTPGAGGVQAAHGLAGRICRPADELDDEPLRSAGRQRENDLKDGRLSDEALPGPILPGLSVLSAIASVRAFSSRLARR